LRSLAVPEAGFAEIAGLDRNGYDKSLCQDEFEAYKACKRLEVGLGACACMMVPDLRSIDSCSSDLL
jgi:hypothetical protein